MTGSSIKKPTKARAKKVAAPAETVAAYKAFDKNLACRGHQFEVGKTYGPIDNIAMCRRGFHSCTDPLDVLNYYDIASSRFATVKAGGAISTKDDGDSKICSATISAVAELKLPDFIRAAVKATIDACKVKGLVSSGHYATNASSGHYAKNASSGHSATNEATGEKSTIAAAGLNSMARGVNGTAIALPYKDTNGQIRFACGVVGEDGIPADTWLIAKGGKLVAA